MIKDNQAYAYKKNTLIIISLVLIGCGIIAFDIFAIQQRCFFQDCKMCMERTTGIPVCLELKEWYNNFRLLWFLSAEFVESK